MSRYNFNRSAGDHIVYM